MYDIAIIGAGPGGYVAAIRASQLGFKTALVEKRKTLGGTCLNVGCIPSKTLLQSTQHLAFVNDHAKDHGIYIKGVSVDFKKMMDRKKEVVASLAQGVDYLIKKNKVTKIHGKAVFNQEGCFVGDERVEAKYYILATGSQTIELPFLPFDEKRIISSTGALSLEKVPKKLVVIGAGVIGLELASVYNRLGSKVTIIEMLDRVCPSLDPGMSKILYQILKNQGIDFHLSTQVKKAKVDEDRVSLFVECEERKNLVEADIVLVAVGRKPYSEGLGLETIGVEQDERGFVKVDQSFQTSKANIFAIGDLIKGPMLAHRASEEGVAVVEMIAGHKPNINYMTIPNVVYTHPEVATVGLTEKQAKEAGLKIKVGTYHFRGNARAKAVDEMEGLVKVLGEEKSERVLGVHIIGPCASELISEGMVALKKKMTLKELGEQPNAHPTFSEAVKEAALNALSRAIHT